MSILHNGLEFTIDDLESVSSWRSNPLHAAHTDMYKGILLPVRFSKVIDPDVHGKRWKGRGQELEGGRGQTVLVS